MRNVFAFFYRIRSELLLIGLLLLCFQLLFKTDPSQRASFAKASGKFGGAIYDLKGGVTGYFNLKEENKKLLDAIGDFRTKSKQSFSIIPSKQFEVNDTLYRQNYLYQSAEVINSTINKPMNNLTINRGSVHGVKIGSGIISSKGLVGIVTHTSSNYSIVMPIINNRFTGSVEIKNKRFFGLLRWPAGNVGKALIDDIADYADIIPGDTVISRGASATFPRGIMVGTVSEINRVPELGKLEISVDLSVDFASLRYVLVVNNVYRDEILELESKN